MMLEQMACYLIIVWAIFRVQQMLPDAPLVDKLGISVLGGSAVWYLAELYIYGSTHDAQRVMLIGLVLWVLPPSIRCYFSKINVPAPIRVLMGMRK